MIRFPFFLTKRVETKVGIDIVDIIMLAIRLPVSNHNIFQDLIKTVYIRSKPHIATLYCRRMNEVHNIHGTGDTQLLKKIVIVNFIFGKKSTKVTLSVGLTIYSRQVGGDIHHIHRVVHTIDGLAKNVPQCCQVT